VSPAYIVAAVLAVIVVLLGIVYFHTIPSDRDNQKSGNAYGPTTAQSAAVTAATIEAINSISYSRKTFAADFARAQKGASGKLTTYLNSTKTLTLNTMNDGKFDLSAKAPTPGAYEGQSKDGKSLLVLVTVVGYKDADGAAPVASGVERFEATMQQIKGKWLATDLEVVGVE
jgi:hypothetical protein